MTAEDAIFEDIRNLSDEAEALGLEDVAMVLEFALDVYLKERGLGREAQPVLSKIDTLEHSAERASLLADIASERLPKMSFSMTTFPLARVMRQAS